MEAIAPFIQGAIIGADGFGFCTQIRNVIMEDNVDISCATIDRATMGSTIIRKLDNQIQMPIMSK
jgi:UDP-3-O-[3-hydroxymyristoyl] glucosamine N-acyltransferase